MFPRQTNLFYYIHQETQQGCLLSLQTIVSHTRLRFPGRWFSESDLFGLGFYYFLRMT